MRNLLIFILALLMFFFTLGGKFAFANERAAGDFMVVFKPSAMISFFKGNAPEPLLDAMLEFQGEYLRSRYGVEIKGTYPEITRSSGKGMFHVHSRKAALSDAMFDDVMKILKNDPELESVSENRLERISIK